MIYHGAGNVHLAARMQSAWISSFRLFAVAACLLAGVTGQNPAMAQDSAADDARARQQLAAVTKAIAEVESWLDRADGELDSSQEALRQAELEVSTLRQEIASLEANIAAAEADLAALQQRQSALQAEQNSQAALLSEVLRAAYMAGNYSQLRLLLDGDDPGKAARMLHYAGEFSRHQLTLIDQFRATLAELDSVGQQLNARLAELNDQQRQLQQRNTQLTAARDQRASALTALREDIQTRNQELEQLQFDQAELEALLAEIARAMAGIRSFADVPPLTEQQGRLAFPVSGPIVSRFGSPYGGGSLVRQGIVIAASEGSPVRAVHPGRVVFADWLRGAGLLVIIDHGEGYMSLYGGNEALAAEAGDWVDQGEVIATSGRGANSNEPGLYFEIRRRGTAVDPARWLASGG